MFFFFQAEDGIRDLIVTGVQTCALPISNKYFDETMLMEINTDVYEGRVMLTGAVTKAATKKKAELIARRVKGVREIFKEIQGPTNGGGNARTRDLSILIQLKVNILPAQGGSYLN